MTSKGGRIITYDKNIDRGKYLGLYSPCHLLLTRTKTMAMAMDKQDIKDLFDSNLDMTLRELSRITGRTVKELKRILMEEE